MAKGIVALAVVVVALSASGAAGSRSTQTAGCPSATFPLSGINPIGPAVAAALRRVPNDQKPQVRGATLAIADTLRGPQVRTQCGKIVASRTIVVYILRRAYLPAQSASQGVFFVSRFANGYRVWQVAH